MLPSPAPSALLLLAAFAAMAGAADPAVADADWPQFRRESRRHGDHPGVVLTPPLARTLAVRFASPIYASPAIVAGRIYVQDAQGTLACIDHARQRVLWTCALGGRDNASSPAVAHGRVYVGSMAGFLAVVDAGDGSVVARIPLAGGVQASPAVVGAAVYAVGRGGELLRTGADGRVAWRLAIGRLCPHEFAADAQRIAVLAGDAGAETVIVRDAGDRAEVVERKPVERQMCPTSGPLLLADGRLAFQCYDSEFGSFQLAGRLLAVDGHDGRGMPALRGDLLVRGDKAWSLAGFDAKALRTHPQAGGRDLPPAWRVDAHDLYDGGSHSSPALARDHVVIGDERGGVQVIPLAGGAVRKPAWRYVAPGPAGRANAAFSSSPALAPGLVAIGGEDGMLYGFGSGPEAPPIDVAPAAAAARAAPPAPLSGGEWPTVGGGMGFAAVAAGRWPKPPLRALWWTRVWSTMKACPVVADGVAVAAGRSGALTALDAATGAIRWRTHHPGVEARPGATLHRGAVLVARMRGGQGGSPHSLGLSGGPDGGGLWCHDLATGALRWHAPAAYAYQFNADGVVADGDRVLHCRRGDGGALLAEGLDLATGAVRWSTPLPGVRAGGALPPRFAAVAVPGRFCIAVAAARGGGAATIALDSATGTVAWTAPQGLGTRSRLAARDGVVVVFNAAGAHAFDAAGGAALWTAAGAAIAGEGYQMPLTDDFLASRGERGRPPFAVTGCRYPIWADGLWWTHDPSTRWSANRLVAIAGDAPKAAAPAPLWSHPFLANACASPAFAYGRLYYAANGEGIVHCFAGAGE